MPVQTLPHVSTLIPSGTPVSVTANSLLFASRLLPSLARTAPANTICRVQGRAFGGHHELFF